MLGARRRNGQHGARQHLVAIAGLTCCLLLVGLRPAFPNTVTAISRGVDSSGRTTIIIACAEPIESGSFRSYPVPDPPRAVVILEGISEPVKPEVLIVDDRYIHQVRLGHQRDQPTPELHVILDLTSAEVQILDTRNEDGRLIVEVGMLPVLVRTSTPLSSSTPFPSPVIPTPTPQASPTPTALVPTPEPSPTTVIPTPTLEPSPSPEPAPSATVTPSFPDRPAPPVLPPPSREPSPAPTVNPSSAPHAFATPTPDPEPINGTRIVDIASSLRSDGSTLLRITADGRLPLGCARTLEVNDDPPRIIVTIRAVSAPDLPRSIEVGDSNLDRVRLVHDAEASEGELHLVLYLAKNGISLAEVSQVGPHLVVQLNASPAL